MVNPGLMSMAQPNPAQQSGVLPGKNVATTTIKATQGTHSGLGAPMAQASISPNPAVPATGLIGYEQALGQGLGAGAGVLAAGAGDSMNTLNKAMGSVGGPQNFHPGSGNVTKAIGQGVDALTGYNALGQNAAEVQANLSGANGPEAQALAYEQYQSSPAMQYQMDQMQRATERSAAARGGLMGGNVLRELQSNAAGIASQDYQNQFNNLGQVSGMGLNAAGQIGNLRANEASLANSSNIAQMNSKTQQKMAQEQIKASLAKELASTQYGTGVTGAQMMTQTGGLMAQGRWNAGQAMSDNINNTTSQIANLVNNQGGQLSDMMSRDLGFMTEMIYQSGLQDKVDSQQLASILANISGGQASQVNSNYQNIGAGNAAGTTGTNAAFQQFLQDAIATGALD